MATCVHLEGQVSQDKGCLLLFNIWFSAFRKRISGYLRTYSPCWHRKCPAWHIPAADRTEWRPGGSCLRSQLHARGRGRVGGQGASVKAAEDGNLSPCCAAGKVHLAQCLHLWEEASEHRWLQASSMWLVCMIILLINMIYCILHIVCYVNSKISATRSHSFTQCQNLEGCAEI